MDDGVWLAEQFEAHRRHLNGVAFRMLGSRIEADDAVQEAWLRVTRARTDDVANLGGWLTTIVARVCLDMLRTRTSRREDPVDMESTAAAAADDDTPERQALLGDAVSAALMIVLDALNPAERVAFVLHDLFDIPFDQIAPIIGKSAVAARQLASRARRRVRLVNADPRVRAQDEIVHAFLLAAREGNFEGLLRVLDPSVVMRADAGTIAMGSQAEVRGADALAAWLSGKAAAAQPALIEGVPGLVWVSHGELRVAFSFTFADDRIAAIDLIADPQRLQTMQIDF